MKDFDQDFKRAERFLSCWFVFVALLAIAVLAGVAFVVYRLMLYFGIM